MKKLQLLVAVPCLAAVIGVVGARSANAQDPLKVAPNMYKLLFENERVRVMEVTFNPGDSILPHSHPDHHLYALSGGKLKISHPDGTSMDAEIKAGDILWINAEIHWAKNIGTTPVKLVVNELKEPKPKPTKEEKPEEKKEGK